MMAIKNLCVSVSVLALAFPALASAQTVTTSPEQPQPQWSESDRPAAAESTPPTDAAVADIVVTGSRAATNGNRAPTPVTVVTTQALLQSTPRSIPDALTKIPQFSQSTGPGRFQPGVSGLTSVGNYLNLRGVGINRSLILFDGRRVPANTDSGFVDTNTLPQLLIQRVDVVTAGASAAYGSDAVSGVVNFVLDRNFTGLKGVAQGGVSSRGDGGNYRLGLAGGLKFAGDRGHLLGSVEYSRQNAIQHDDRPLSGRFLSKGGAGTAASPYTIAENTSFQLFNPGGVVTSAGPLAGFYFVPGGIASIDPGQSIGGGLRSGGTPSRFSTGADIFPNVSTVQAYGRASFEVSPALVPYVDISFARSRSVSNNINTFTFGQTIFSGNAFLPAAAQSLLTAGGTPSFSMGRLNLEFPFYVGDVTSKSFTGSVGADGDLGGGWKYNAYYSHGEGRLNVQAENVLDNQKYFAASDAVRDASGNIVCRVTVTNPGLYPGCVPINLFGTGSPSPQSIAYVLGTSRFNTLNKLDVAAVNVSGTPLSLPGGDVSLAGGIEYRHQSLRQTTNADPASPPAFTGIRGVPAGSLAYSNTNAGSADGAYTVKEAYLEAIVPVFADFALGKSLELNAAGRVTNYSTSGTVVTWKAGGIYEPIDGLRFRVTRSRDIRAPSLTELFASLRQSQTPFNDIHTGASGSIFLQVVGNQDLKPEKADTFTVGAVLQPSILRGFSASVDFYDLKIDNAITTLTPANINQQCETSGGTLPICSLVVRPNGFSDRSPTNYPTSIRQVPFNAASLRTRGIDIDISQRFALGGETSLSTRVLANYLIDYETKITAIAAPIDESGILGRPHWSVTGFVDLKAGPFTASYQGRYYSRVVQDNVFVYTTGALHIPSYFISDLTLSMDFGKGAQTGTFFVTVNNLFDKQPPLAPQEQLPGYTYGTYFPAYDVVGRTFTAGVRFKF